VTADRVHGNDQSQGGLGGYDLDDFSRRVRKFAIDARHILGHPDNPPVELIRLHRRVSHLLRDARGAPSKDIRRWLLAAMQAIDARILALPFAELESSVA
jgi:hypothetical protein